ncbi:hypothetical protein R52603_05789 [Paraburkholderia saeva]|nr:hypothetical protein R70241_05793 [Paraburkholderia saeva]CAG4929172.1 hypothetical protein R52603_05789 [Paraburkholderia saeva]
MPGDEIPQGFLIHHHLFHLLQQPFDLEFHVEGVEVLAVNQRLPDHFLQRHVLEGIGLDDPLAESGKPRLDAQPVGGFVAAYTDTLDARDHAVEGGGFVIDGFDIADRGYCHALIDLQPRTPSNVLLAVEIELRRGYRHIRRVVLAESSAYPELHYVEVVFENPDPDPQTLAQTRARVAQRVGEAFGHSIHSHIPFRLKGTR